MCIDGMMPRYIAFLRAINVGGHTVKMDQLRNLFQTMGYSNVETFIASGNVIFSTPGTDTAALERTIAEGLQAALGYRVDAFIRTPSELADVAAKWPFDQAERELPHSDYVAFLGAVPDEAAQAGLTALATAVDAFHIDGREVYWLRRDALGESAFAGAVLEKELGMPATLRNGRTVRRIVAKLG